MAATPEGTGVGTDGDGDIDDGEELLCLRGARASPLSPPSSLRQSIEEPRLLMSAEEKEAKSAEREKEREKKRRSSGAMQRNKSGLVFFFSVLLGWKKK